MSGTILGPSVSRHFNRNAERRETHPGLGYINPEGYAVYAYRNSFDRWSMMVGREWRWPLNAVADAAVALGLVTGYPQAPIVPALVPAVLVKVRAAELSFGFLPPIGGVKGALTLQARFRIGD